MTDREALNFLADRLESKAAVATALGVSQQRLSNWYERGIAAPMRGRIWAMVNDHGGHLSREWLLVDASKAKAQAA